MKGKIDKMFGGVHINTTEDRSVLHCALRAPRDSVSHSSTYCNLPAFSVGAICPSMLNVHPSNLLRCTAVWGPIPVRAVLLCKTMMQPALSTQVSKFMCLPQLS